MSLAYQQKLQREHLHQAQSTKPGTLEKPSPSNLTTSTKKGHSQERKMRAKKATLKSPHPSKPPLFGTAKHSPMGRPDRDTNLTLLKTYNEEILGIDPKLMEAGETGESICTLPNILLFQPESQLEILSATPLQSQHPPLLADPTSWKADLPTRAQLYCNGFGKPTKSHSFTQTACADTCLHLILKSGYLTYTDKRDLFAGTNPLVQHLDNMRMNLFTYDFRWLRNPDTQWADQLRIDKRKSIAMLACLFHYDLDVSLLMRYLGNNYTAAHRDVQQIVHTITPHVEPYLIPHFIRVMTVGCPAVFNAESSRENSLNYWRAGNNKSIAQNIDAVMKTMNKEERNKFVVPLSAWTWRFIKNLHYIPQHLLILPPKKDRQISDSSMRYDETSISVNMMTSVETELDCEFGTALIRVLQRVWNLRITYPDRDIVIHANDVKSCFRQLKHHPDVMGAFSYILGDFLFLQIGQSFGATFSPANWEVVRRVAEQLAEGLFADKSLRTKHRKYLDRLRFHKKNGSTRAKFVPAKACNKNTGVRDDNGDDVNTPHALFVDDDLYADIFIIERIEQAVAASIEAIFILLGESDLLHMQDPVSFEKMEDLIVAFRNIILGQVIDTRKMTVQTPAEYVLTTVHELQRHWHSKRKTFKILEIEKLAGRLCHIGNTAPWLHFLMSHVYTSITAALKEAEAELVHNHKQFRSMLKNARKARANQPKQGQHDPESLALSFAQSTTARMVHHSNKLFCINKTLKQELQLITAALTSSWIDTNRPIGHMIPRDPSGIGWSDSSLDAAGGYSLDMRFYWYIHWPEQIQRQTLRYIKNNDNNTLISINVLEYAALIINYVAATHYYQTNPDPSDPYPSVLLYADNTTAESWVIKACKKSFIGRALGRLQCALMINNNVGINVAHITTKDNVIADRISRIKRETNILPELTSLFQDFPQLKSCNRFLPSAELISLVMQTLLQESVPDPILASRQALCTPGRITT